jgi:hypothetical protein
MMVPHRRAWPAAIAAVAVAAYVNAPSNAATVRFPSVSSQNLNGRTMNLPSDFQAPASIVFVAYERNQQAQVDSWKPFVTDLRRRFPALGVYEVPTLAKSSALFRGFIDGGMRRGIPATADRATTITLYIDKRPFDDALGISSEDAITILLVRPDGEVLWRSTGAYAADKSVGLEAAIPAGNG